MNQEQFNQVYIAYLKEEHSEDDFSRTSLDSLLLSEWDIYQDHPEEFGFLLEYLPAEGECAA